MKICATPGCGKSLAGMRSHAIYHSRDCKTRASDLRRTADGRGIARDRARYEQEADHRRAYAMKYLAENQERMRAIRRKRKGQIKAQICLVTDRDWRRLVARYRGCCAYCHEPCANLQREHVIPLSRGGRQSIGNLVPACAACNYRKRTKFLSEWRYQIAMSK